MSQRAVSPVGTDLVARHRAYQEMVGRLRDLIHRRTPPGAVVVVVSKGDPDLVSLVGRRGWHFLQDSNGEYAGYHPRDSAAAIEQLEALRSRGADFLVIPASSNWWLQHYAEFGNHLRLRYDTVAEEMDAGTIYALRQQARPVTSADVESPASDLEFHRHALLAAQITDLIDHLAPRDQAVSIVQLEHSIPFQLDGRDTMQLTAGPSLAATTSSPQVVDGLVTQLRNHRQQGAAFLIVPRSAFEWWAEHGELRLAVELHHRCVTRQAHVCLVYELDPEDP